MYVLEHRPASAHPEQVGWLSVQPAIASVVVGFCVVGVVAAKT